jgi:hypothetical protein
MTTSRTKDEPFHPMGMKDRLNQRFDFQNQRLKYSTLEGI